MDIKDYIEGGIIESYVLGLASEQESAELLIMSAKYPEVQKSVEDFEILLEQKAFENAIQPPSPIKYNLIDILKEYFSSEKNTPVVSINNNEQKILYPKNNFWRYLAAAAILLFIVSAGLNFYFYNDYQTVESKYTDLVVQNQGLQANNDIFRTRASELDESLKTMSDSSVKVIKMISVKRTNDLATIYWNERTNDVYIFQNSLPQTSPDKQYQVWAIVNGKPVDAGLLDNCTGLCKLNNIKNAQAFAITLENKGGSVTPTMTAMYVMGKV